MIATPTPNENKKTIKHKKLIITLLVILIFCITFVSTFFIMVKLGEKRLRDSLVSNEKIEAVEDDGADVIYHNGKKYVYNEKLINILFIGVDRKKDTKTEQGQADALYLVSVDTENDKVKIISISRNTLCDIDILDLEGNAYGQEYKQICLAYAYGNDDIRSSENCVKATSEFLYGIPINGYYTLHLDAINKIVDSVGGVKVKITDNDADTSFANKKGQTVTLTGANIMSYLQTRGDSNAPRVERHKEFISGFVNSAKAAVSKDLKLPFKIANDLKKHSVTNIDISSGVYLAIEALNWNLEFVNIKGEYGIKDDLEIFTVDDNALKDLIVGNFYITKK